MQYVLVQNKQTILLGPINWRHRFIQTELNDLEVDFTLSPTEPNAYVKINDELEIYPVTGLEIPSHNSTHEQLDGPYWTFVDGVAANGTYNIAGKPVDAIKNELKALTAAERYKKEIAGIKLTVQGVEVALATDRDTRNLYVQKLITMTDTDTVQWKFNENWLTLTKEDMTNICNAVNAHVQTQYDWEANIVNQINSAADSAALQTITIVE